MTQFNLNLDPFALIIIGLILIFGLRSWWESSQQTAAFKRMADAAENQYFISVYEHRARAQQTIEYMIVVEDWLSEQSGYKFLSIDTISHKPLALSFLAKSTNSSGNKHIVDNVKVVVSPLNPMDLKMELAKYEGDRRIDRQVPLLGYTKPFTTTPTFEKNLMNGGIWFDIAAGRVGEKFGLDWGHPERLYFYIIKL